MTQKEEANAIVLEGQGRVYLMIYTEVKQATERLEIAKGWKTWSTSGE